MATKAAPPKTYDPVKALEGMFNGSVTRIAQALRDPSNFGASTKTVLTEVAKRYHDALDDCEIQLLDAKWYLEHQLAQNRLRREAKARELGMAAKRKHDEMNKEEEQTAATEEPSIKKPKVDEEKNIQVEAKIVKPTVADDAVPAAATLDQNDNKKVAPPSKAKTSDETPAPDDFAKPTPQGSPTATNEEFFESMFGDANATGTDNDLGFDLGLDNSFDDGQMPGALDSLVPDLDDLTNQPPDVSAADANIDALPAFSNDFDLPDFGGPNVFDDLMNDDGLGGDLGDNVDLSDQALLDMDFDAGLFN